MIAHGASRVSVMQEPSPGRGERIRRGDKLFRLVRRPSGADSPLWLIPRLTPWAMILRLSEAVPMVHNLGNLGDKRSQGRMRGYSITPSGRLGRGAPLKRNRYGKR